MRSGKKDSTVTKSQIAAGLEQGLRYVSMIVVVQPPDVRSVAMAAYRNAIQSEYPDFLEKDKQRLDKVLKRGRVRTESESYLPQHRVDEIEGGTGNEKELHLLYRLMDEYGGAKLLRSPNSTSRPC